MAARVTIGGVDHFDDIVVPPTAQISLLQNGRSQMRFRCRSGYQPARFAEVVAYAQDGVTAFYGGIILQRALAGAVSGSVPAVMDCDVVGFETYLDWGIVSLAYSAATTLQVVLDDLVAALPAGYGLTLDATDYTGVALAAPLAWTNARASDVLRALCEQTGRVYQVSPLKVLSVPIPGLSAAPVTVTDADPHCQEVTWRDPVDPAATTVILLCGTGTAAKQEQFLGSDRTDDPGGDYSYFTVPYHVPADINQPWPNQVNVGGSTIGGPVLWGADVGHGWGLSWDYVAHRLQWDRTILGDCDNAWTIDLAYTAQYPFEARATTGAAPEVAVVETRPDLTDATQAQAAAVARLAILGGSPREVEIVSLDVGWQPGQGVVVDLVDRALDATCAVTAVDIDLLSDRVWRSRVTATELTTFAGNYLDQWRALLAKGLGAVGAGPGSSSSAVFVPGLPGPIYLGGSRFHAVQVPA